MLGYLARRGKLGHASNPDALRACGKPLMQDRHLLAALPKATCECGL